MRRKNKNNQQTVATIRPPDPIKEKRRASARAKTVMILRIVLWTILSFVFVRGVLDIVLPKDRDEVSAREELAAYRSQHATEERAVREIYPFAEEFIREWFTYANGGENDYRARLGAYAAPHIYRDVSLNAKGSASVDAVSAFRAEQVNANQYDVWVRVAVRYAVPQKNKETEKVTTKYISERAVLIVPIATTGTGYIVEDTPIFTADLPAPAYTATPYSGTAAGEATAAQISQSLANFYTAYFNDDESVIAYYLAPGADPDAFVGLHGQFTFKKVADCKAYVLGDGSFIALATVNVTTANGQLFAQHYHLKLVESGGQYYVEAMDPRTSNINNINN